MAAKILVLIGIIALVYAVTQRQKIIGKFFGPPDDGGGGPKHKGPQNRGPTNTVEEQSSDTIEELEKDPVTGHYKIKSNKKDK